MITLRCITKLPLLSEAIRTSVPSAISTVSNILYPGADLVYRFVPYSVFGAIATQSALLASAVKLGHMSCKTNNKKHKIALATGACLATLVGVCEFLKYREFITCFNEVGRRWSSSAGAFDYYPQEAYEQCSGT